VITTGKILPFLSCVLSLKALMNSMIGKPCWPKAGPTGGAGVAVPAGIFSFINVLIFLAISTLLSF